MGGHHTASWADREGLPFPLGQSWIPSPQSYNFALYSKHATRVRLLFFREDDLFTPVLTLDLNHLIHKSGRIWHARVRRSETNGARYYAYQIDGPRGSQGDARHAFDPEKLAVDPYARSVYFPETFHRHLATVPGSNIGYAPLAVLSEWTGDSAPPPRRSPRHESDLIIYEMHVRGFTRHPSSGLAENKRGTYAGVIEKIPHLLELGVTAVELMPVFQFDPQEGNYWGYNPLFFFTPHAGYAATSTLTEIHAEFRAMVDALHDAGIEVILDAVYNHSGEGDADEPRYCFKLIDNSLYYMVSPVTGEYLNYSGTGNSLNASNRAVRHLIVESMRYWVTELGVDGFRLDLAAVLTRNADGSVNLDDPPIFGQITADPILGRVRLIAEPWDAMGAYQLGRDFPGMHWWQWNGRYRDAVQKFVRGDPGMVGEMMSRVYGSADLFPDDVEPAYRPYQSVNYAASHDGFSLYDLVSYNRKRNEDNGHDNQDGHHDYSWNCGWEGDDEVPEDVMRLRRKQIRNVFALLCVSNGTVMFRMGDEFGQTQRGNNNPYNQDNETTWLDWNRLTVNRDLFRFAREMIAFRKRNPSLCRSRYWRDDVSWHGVGPMPDLLYESRAFAYAVKPLKLEDPAVYVMINAHGEDLEFEIQQAGPWRLAVDTAKDSPADIHPAGTEPRIVDPHYRVEARSVVVLLCGGHA